MKHVYTKFCPGDTVYLDLERIIIEHDIVTEIDHFGTRVRTVASRHSYDRSVMVMVELDGLTSSYYPEYLKLSTQEEVDEQLRKYRGAIEATKYGV